MIKISKLISVIFILLLSTLLAYVSFSGGTPEAYLFPKIITSVMMILSSLALVLYFFDKEENFAKVDIKKLSIYLISLILFISFGEFLGFYFLAILLFIIICYFYSERKTVKTFIYSLLVTFLFMICTYFLFSILLKVQVPRFFIF
tara:strand:- start:44 stop:481 length:438 start_codon:yes stop_codon:yes gene_type:complete